MHKVEPTLSTIDRNILGVSSLLIIILAIRLRALAKESRSSNWSLFLQFSLDAYISRLFLRFIPSFYPHTTSNYQKLPRHYKDIYSL